MSDAANLNLTANAYLTAITQNDYDTGDQILAELSRDDLNCVAAALAGAFNGYLRGLAKKFGHDPDTFVRDTTTGLGIYHATNST